MSDEASPQSLRRDAEVVGLIVGGHATTHFLQLLLPPLFPWLMSKFALSYTELGGIITVYSATSLACQAFAGLLVDRVGALRVLRVGMALLAGAAAMTGLATGYASLIVAAVVAGVGNSVVHPADFAILNRHVSQQRLGHAFSAHGLSGYVGWAAAPVTIGGVAALAGWRAAAFTGAAVPLAVLVLLSVRRASFGGRLPPAGPGVAAVAAGSPFAFLGVAAVWMCFLFFLFSTLAASAVQNFAAPVLRVTHRLSLEAATAALTLYLLGGAVGILTGGFLASRNDAHDRRIAVSLCVAALLATVLATGATAGWTVSPLMAAVGFFTGIAAPSRDLLVRRAALGRSGPRSYGRVYGFVYSAIDLGGAAAPLFFGRLLDRGLFHHVLGAVAILQGMAIVTALDLGRRTRPLPAPVVPGNA